MSSTTTDQSPNGSLGPLGKLLHLDPVLLTAMVTLVSGVAAVFGVELTEGKSQVFAVGGLAVITVAAQLWARRKTLAKKKVLAFLPHPTKRPGYILAGPATTTASDGMVLGAVRSPSKA